MDQSRPGSNRPKFLVATWHCAGGRPCLDRALLAELLMGLLTTHPATVAACLLPDHLHWLLAHSDVGCVGRFESWSSSCAARLGLRGPLWSGPAHSEVVVDPAATAAHILANPVRLGLVCEPQRWPWSYHSVASVREIFTGCQLRSTAEVLRCSH